MLLQILLLPVFFAICCAGTQHTPPYPVEIRTTFLTVTKPCSSNSTTIVAQSTYISQHTVVQKEEYQTVTTKQTLVTYTRKVENPELVSSTTHIVIQSEDDPWPKYITTTTWSHDEVISDYTPPPTYKSKAADVNTVVHIPKVEVSSPDTAHLEVQETYSTSILHETTTEVTHLLPQSTDAFSASYYEPPQSIWYATSSIVPANTQVVYHPQPPPPIKEDESSTTSIYTSTTTSYSATYEYSSTTAQTIITTTLSSVYVPPVTQYASATAPTNVYTYFPTVACACPAETTAPKPTYLPKLPLTKPSVQGLSSFLDIVLSIPDYVLSGGDDAVTTFYTNLSTCVSSNGEELKKSLLGLSPVFDTIEDKIQDGVKEAGDFIDGLFNPVAEDAAPVATSIIADVGEQITAVPDLITSALVPIITNLNQFPDLFPRVPQREAAPKDQPPRSSILDIFSNIDSLRACLSSAIATNPVFEVAQCAASIASVALPAARLLRVKRTVAAIQGGVKRFLKDVAEAKNVNDLARSGTGRRVLDVLGELTGLSDAVKDCKFIVD